MKINRTRHIPVQDTRKKKYFWEGCMLKLVIMSTFFTNDYCKMVLIYEECGRQERIKVQRLLCEDFPTSFSGLAVLF